MMLFICDRACVSVSVCMCLSHFGSRIPEEGSRKWNIHDHDRDRDRDRDQENLLGMRISKVWLTSANHLDSTSRIHVSCSYIFIFSGLCSASVRVKFFAVHTAPARPLNNDHGHGHGIFILATYPEETWYEQPIPNPLSPSIPAQTQQRALWWKKLHCRT